MDPIVRDLVDKIKSGKIDPKNAITIVQYISKAVCGDQDAAIQIVELVAKGADGIAGTEDDVIPPETLKQLESLLKSQLVGQLTTALSGKRCCF